MLLLLNIFTLELLRPFAYQLIATICEKLNRVNIPLSLSSPTEVFKLSVCYGLGIGFLPELFVRPVIEEGKVCQILLKENIPEREICLVENHTFPPSIAAEMFKKMLVLK